MRPETAYLIQGIGLVIGFQRESVNNIIESAADLPKKEKEIVLDLCYECTQLIEGARIYAVEEAKKLYLDTPATDDFATKGQSPSLKSYKEPTT